MVLRRVEFVGVACLDLWIGVGFLWGGEVDRGQGHEFVVGCTCLKNLSVVGAILICESARNSIGGDVSRYEGEFSVPCWVGGSSSFKSDYYAYDGP